MAKEGKIGNGTGVIHITASLTWPFSLEQYQNGKIHAGAEMDVPEGYEDQGYKKLFDICEKVVADEKDKIFGKGE